MLQSYGYRGGYAAHALFGCMRRSHSYGGNSALIVMGGMQHSQLLGVCGTQALLWGERSTHTVMGGTQHSGTIVGGMRYWHCYRGYYTSVEGTIKRCRSMRELVPPCPDGHHIHSIYGVYRCGISMIFRTSPGRHSPPAPAAPTPRPPAPCYTEAAQKAPCWRGRGLTAGTASSATYHRGRTSYSRSTAAGGADEAEHGTDRGITVCVYRNYCTRFLHT